MLKDPVSHALAGLCALGAVVISIYQILCHLRNYTEPVFQRYIVRIIFMVPCYATASWFSLVFRGSAIYFDTIRDCYEAWVLYNFLSLCLAYVGGPGAVVNQADGKIIEPSWSWGTCCLPPMPIDGFFLRRCKQGTLQFVLMKPLLASFTLIMYAADRFEDGVWDPAEGYLWVTIMYNMCYTCALYSLLLFYIGCEHLLQPFKPLLKFILVKTVIFLTFWQGIAVSVVSSLGKIKDPADGKAIQNFIICLEMLGAAVMMLFAFPHSDFNVGGQHSALRASNMVHAISIRDVFADTVHQFAPTYQDYVLYSDNNGVPMASKRKPKPKGKVPFNSEGGNGKSEHPKSNLLENMEKGAVTGLAAVVEDAMEREDYDNTVKKPQKKEKAGKQPKKLPAWGKADKNTMVLVDSDSDEYDSGDEDNQLELQDDANGAMPARIRTTSDEEHQGPRRDSKPGGSWSNVDLSKK